MTWNSRISWCCVAVLCLGAAQALAATAAPGRQMKQYQTKYYVIYTDLDKDDVREASLRMTAMVDEYSQRTRDFSAVLRERLDFYLYSRPEDYYAADGPLKSGGVFAYNRLMAIAGSRTGAWTWQTIQHEGFHQFAHAAIGHGLPVWVNEGLADYFGYAIYTGDGFVSGVIPPAVLKRVQALIRDNKALPFETIMQIQPGQWIDNIKAENYDQAWSMVHFLAHGDGGKYRSAFAGFIRDVSKNMYWKEAWKKSFGPDTPAFQKRCRDWWLAQPDYPTNDLYIKAVVTTLTNFLARSVSQKQAFATGKEFFAAAGLGTLKADPADWLPPKLLEENVELARQAGAWSIMQPPGQLPQLKCQLRNGATFVGQFTLNGARVGKVTVVQQTPASQPTGAKGPSDPRR